MKRRFFEPEILNREVLHFDYAQVDFEEINIYFVNLFRKIFGSDIVEHILNIGSKSTDITLSFVQAFSICLIDGTNNSKATFCQII